MLDSFSNRKRQRDSWWLVAIGFLEACHTAASATKARPNTRSEVSAKLKLSQLSTLQRRHSSLIWPFATMETVERMAFWQWSLLDICMFALCLVLVIDVNWIAARMRIVLARLAGYWTRANICSSSIAKVARWSTHSRTGKGNVIPGSW